MIKKIAAAAILMCAVMVLVAGAPLVTADTHHIVKGAQGPRASAVSWGYTPTDNGIWTGHVVNTGLRSLVIDVVDNTTGAASSILHQRIRFAATGDTMDTLGAIMAKDRIYVITATPNGPRGTSCTVDDAFTVLIPPVAMFNAAVIDATVSVDGSASYDPNAGGSISAWGWDFGDGTTGTGVTASHTYTVSNTYTIVLTVLSSSGMTGSTSKNVIVVVPVPVDQKPIARFTYTTNSLTLNVDGSTSTDDHPPLSAWAWSWGDGSTDGSGVTASHKYAAKGTYTVKLTVTDSIGQTNSTSKQIPIVDNPPVAAFSSSSVSWTATLDASASTDDFGIVSWAWNFGDLSSGTGVSVTHTYAASGTYTVMLTVTDTIGQTNSVSHPVTVIDNPPVASFTQTNSSLTVNVVSTSTDDYGIVSYLWNFGDGTTATGPTASHTYATPASLPVVSGQSSILAGPPPLPFYIFGYLTDSAGNPVVNAVVTITNQRTLDSVTGILSDVSGFYSYDISTLLNGYVAGDTILVSATNPANGATASGSGIIGTTPYIQIDLVLAGALPVTLTVTITLTVTDTVGQTSVTSQTIRLVK